jgi:hypothetical protein
MNKKIIVTLAAFLLLMLFFVVANHSRAAKHNVAPQKRTGGASQPAATTPQDKPAAASVIHASFRPLNLALLSGGFTSVDEFQQRIANDPTLHSFFGSCSDTQASMQQLPNDILVFATFRRGEDIKWTRKQMLVRKGEYVLTFCGKTVLNRCGNLISWVPMQPSEDVPPSLLEIPTDELKAPQALTLTAQADPAAAESFAGLPSVAAAVAGHHAFFIPPFYIPSGGSSGHSGAPALLDGDEFSGHQAFTTLLLGLFAIGILKLVTR